MEMLKYMSLLIWLKGRGMPRHIYSRSSVVITKDPVSEYVPLQKNEESIVTQYTMTNLERLGLLKWTSSDSET